MASGSEAYLLDTTLEPNALLADWRWKVGRVEFRIHKITAMGDLLLVDSRGCVWMLNTTWGHFDIIATSLSELAQFLKDANFRRELLFSDLVCELRDRGVILAPGQCYGSKHPQCLGGPATWDNFEPTDIFTHVALSGQILRQLQQMPAGTPIREIRVVGPARSFLRRTVNASLQRLTGMFRKS